MNANKCTLSKILKGSYSFFSFAPTFKFLHLTHFGNRPFNDDRFGVKLMNRKMYPKFLFQLQNYSPPARMRIFFSFTDMNFTIGLHRIESTYFLPNWVLNFRPPKSAVTLRLQNSVRVQFTTFKHQWLGGGGERKSRILGTPITIQVGL